MVSFVIWAMAPATLSVYLQSIMLHGEQWGLGFWWLMIMPAWLATGLIWALHWGAMLIPQRKVTAVFLTAALLGIAAFLATARLSPLYFLEGPVTTAFEQLAPQSQGKTIVPIEHDISLGGYGRFVREDATGSTDEVGMLPIGTEEDADFLSLARRATWMVDDCPQGVDALIAFPLNDGWWYLFTDH